jgi:photosystem II stability/assembly factor-like uncharacterized protein
MAKVIIVGTAKGALILRAEDAQAPFAASPLRLPGWLVTSSTQDDAGRFYAAVTHDVWGAAILESDDLEHWNQLEAAPRFAPGKPGNEEHLRIVGAMDPMGNFKDGARYVDQIWKLLHCKGTLYAAVSEAGLFRSTDSGKSWHSLPGIDDHPDRASWGAGFGGMCAHSILVDPARPERIWLGISAAGVFRSDDGGETFVAKNKGIVKAEGYCVHGLAHHRGQPDTLFRQDHRGMYRSYDAGDNWEVCETGLPIAELGDQHRCAFGFTIGLDEASGTLFTVPLAGDSLRFPVDGELRVYQSVDAGDSWQSTNSGLPTGCYQSILRGALAIDSGAPCSVYFGTAAGALYASRDGGQSYSELVTGLPRILSVEVYDGP